jgi:hypothetical protein
MFGAADILLLMNGKLTIGKVKFSLLSKRFALNLPRIVDWKVKVNNA